MYGSIHVLFYYIVIYWDYIQIDTALLYGRLYPWMNIFWFMNRYTGGKSEQILGRYLSGKDASKVRGAINIQ